MILILALIDLLCAASLILLLLGFPLPPLQSGAALLLAAKSLLFITDIFSIMDLVAAICIILLLWFSLPGLAIGIAIYLTLKGLYSLI